MFISTTKLFFIRQGHCASQRILYVNVMHTKSQGNGITVQKKANWKKSNWFIIYYKEQLPSAIIIIMLSLDRLTRIFNRYRIN